MLKYVFLPAVLGAVLGTLWLTWKPAADRDGYAAPVQRAIPAVVNIYSTKRLHRPPICQLPQFSDLCDALAGNEKSSARSDPAS